MDEVDAKEQEQIDAIDFEIKELTAQINEILTKDENDLPLAAVMDKLVAAGKQQEPKGIELQEARVLSGHTGKVYSAAWAQDSRHFVSAAQDGHVVFWDALAGAKRGFITLVSSWVLTVGMSPDMKLIASAGLDNTISIWKRPQGAAANTVAAWRNLDPIKYEEHEGYVSSVTFLDNDRFVSTSGDSSALLWDVGTKKTTRSFNGHLGDIVCCDKASHDPNLFVTGSTDTSSKLWDIRQKSAAFTFFRHNADVNSVSFMDGHPVFASGSDDSLSYVWDIRSCRAMQELSDGHIETPVSAISFSKTGQYLFAGFDEQTGVRAWKVLSSASSEDLFAWSTDDLKSQKTPIYARISAVDVSPNGNAVLTACWDKYIRVYTGVPSA